MKMRTLLLPSAVALLVHLALVSPHPSVSRSNPTGSHLDNILDLAEQCATSLPKESEIFVESVSHLTEGNGSCSDAFFCKVQDILTKHKNLCSMNKNVMLRHLRQYNSRANVTCEETLQGLNSTGENIRATKLLKYIRGCIQRKNFTGQ